jgi:signal transduction histidine kinase
LTFKTQKSGNFVIVSVKDSGTGIPEEIRSRVFEPFFTTKAAGEGTGLGLDIVKKIVERHEGELYFDSEIGKGTTFFVKLPLS